LDAEERLKQLAALRTLLRLANDAFYDIEDAAEWLRRQPIYEYEIAGQSILEKARDGRELLRRAGLVAAKLIDAAQS